MSEEWMRSPGTHGTVVLKPDGDQLVVTSPSSKRRIVLVDSGSKIGDLDVDALRVTGTVSRYVRAAGGGPDFLTLDIEEVQPAKEEGGSDSAESHQRYSPTTTTPPERLSCSDCSGPMHAEDMTFVTKDEIEEVVQDWPYDSGGWVCRTCGAPCRTSQVKEADPRRYYNE